KNENLGKIISFLILYIIINRLVGFIFFIVDRIFRPITHLPFLKTINRLGGAIFGCLTGALTVGLLLYFFTKVPLDWLIKLIENSKFSQYFINLAKILLPLLPEVLKKIESAI
ncbi:MAG: CvpA family protein, partial [Patescibacteria group bacterium]